MPNKLSRFWQELKRRRVIHTIVVYSTAAFVIIELVNNVFEPLKLPDWTPTLIILLLIAGFPLAIVFSWIYDITTKGIRRTSPYSHMNARSNDFTGTAEVHFENSIAVLPFQDMSPDGDQEYFCDGIAEEIINDLTHVGSLKVIARTSSFMFKNKQMDMREIGQLLGVKNLLEGSVRLHRDRIRITAQLINAEDGAHLWSDQFDRSLDDIFAIQDEISLTIVEALKVKLLGEEKVMILKRHTEDLEAYRLYLQAIYFLQLSTPKGNKRAIMLLEQALEKDREFVLAYIGLALAYMGRITYGPMAPGDAYPRIIEYAEKAMKLDPSLAEVYTMQGVINTLYHWNWAEAEKNYKRSLELNPNISATHIFYSYLLNVNCRFAEGIAETQRAVELDPISGYSHSAMGQAYYFSRQFKRAIRELKKAIALDPGNFQAHLFLGLSYVPQKRIIKAYYQIKKAIKTSDGLPMAVSAFAAVNYKTGRKKVARKLLESLIERSSYEYVPALNFFTIYNSMGEYEEAFKWFKKAFNERESLVPWVRINPLGFIERINEPRYKELLDSIGSGQ